MNVAGEQLLTIVERIEHCHSEKKAIEDDIRDIYAEAKTNGFDTAMIRTIVKRRGKDQAQVDQADVLLETYLNAIEAALRARDTPRAPRAGTREETRAPAN
jgi:uncharacterized protein (UPF0335 family)